MSWRRRKRRRRKISDKSGLGRSGRGGGLLPVKAKRISHIFKHEEATEKWTQYIRPTYFLFSGVFLDGDGINCLAIWKEQKHGFPQNVSEWEL